MSESPTPASPATVDSPSSGPRRRSYLDLFLVSFVILFTELACIRWFGSTVAFLTFFTNIVLMACVLGMSVGCLAARRTRNYVDLVVPLTLLTVLLAAWILRSYSLHELVVDVGNQDSPQQIYFGAEPLSQTLSAGMPMVPIEAIAGLFYVLIALMFVGLGQVMGRAFDAIPDRVAAYSTNIAGSLVGIAAFGVASYGHVPPFVWFSIALLPSLWFMPRRRWLHALGVLAIVGIVGFSSALHRDGGRVFWSPYYKVVYRPEARLIETNNIGHQQMVAVSETGPAYSLPHLLNRDAGNPPFQDELIIGAGSGNDVQAALLNGVGHVDAVEIDPVLYAIGRADHPDHPYLDPRVRVHLDDGRSFLHKTPRTYDLVAYALVDSLVLHSGYSSLRLESFLFTEEAFRDVKAKLKPDGLFVMYNDFRQGWVVGRLEKTVEKVFGTKPIVLTLPYRAKITPTQKQWGAISVLIAGNSEKALAPLRKKWETEGRFWLYSNPRFNRAVNGFGAVPPQVDETAKEEWKEIGPAEVDTTGIHRLPTDDWPFLYLRERMIPALNLRGMLIIAVASLIILALFAPVRTVRPNGSMFFLGAGFMLLETKGVVHLALLFGSTWVVNSIVFFAILVMVLLANLFVRAVHPSRLWPYYVLLVVSLLVQAFVPMTGFLALSGAAKIIASCALIFLPIFFAGVIFGSSFRDSRQPDADFGSNIGGIIFGGLAENISLLGGFNSLLFIAIAFYLLAALFARFPRVAPGRVGT